MLNKNNLYIWGYVAIVELHQWWDSLNGEVSNIVPPLSGNEEINNMFCFPLLITESKRHTLDEETEWFMS